MTVPPAGLPLPEGTRLVLDRSVRLLADERVLCGGYPGRLIKLTAAGRRAVAALEAGGPTNVADRRLGRRLVDAGMAHPVPPPTGVSDTGTVTVVVPTRDRWELLDRCLASLGGPGRSAVVAGVVVVDDGSDDPSSVADVCRRHGATLVVRHANGGPAAARNQALPHVDTELVAFVDSDCTVGAGWLDGLLGLFHDPEVGAAAPRVVTAGAPTSVLGRYLASRSPLDLGGNPGPVGTDRLVRYVPTAALVVRRQAFDAVGGFDSGLRFGEDVDWVWRMVAAGWQVRYQPTVEVAHREPSSWSAMLRRRFRYGTSAGPLAIRHPGRLAPVELRPWPAAAALSLVSGHPCAAALVATGWANQMARKVGPLGVPAGEALGWAAQGTGWTAIGVARAATTLWGPALFLGARFGRRDRRRGRAAMVAAMVVVPPLVEWWQRRPLLDPFRWTAAAVLDDLAYGAGVWTGTVRAGTLGPVVPSFRTGG